MGEKIEIKIKITIKIWRNTTLDVPSALRYPVPVNLEDHLGDILSKGCAASGVDASAAARAAGLTLPEWNALAQTGLAPKPLNFAALGRALGLDAGKLQGIAQGWKPAPADLSLWRELRQITTTAGGTTVNCYLAWDEVLARSRAV